MYKTITKCRACDSGNLMPYLNLHDQPPANSFHPKDVEPEKFPLELVLCRSCYHSQLSVVVDPEFLYKHYLYVTGTSNTIKDYARYFADLVYAHVRNAHDGNIPSKFVLDIACNDGTQLDAFKQKGWVTFGVEPATNIYITAQDKGHTVVNAFWGDDALRALGRTQFDAITAQNVFAHVDDALAFLRTCQSVMHDKSILFIQTSQSEMFLQNEFDTAYHEHLSFFNVNSMKTLAERAGMVLENVFKTNIHGTSYVFCLTLNGDVMPLQNVEEVLRIESLLGLYTEQTYMDFASNARRCVTTLRQCVDEARKDGYKVIGFGAAAKGMTVLNFGKVELDYIVDDSPLKQHLYTAGMNIPVYPTETLYTEPDAVVIVPLAWNFSDEIVAKIKRRRNQSDILVTYFPSLRAGPI